MAELIWKFPKLNGGPEQGINDGGIATFKGSMLYTYLAREICQNSLDAKADDKETVVVKFNCQSLEKSKYPSLAAFDKIFEDCRYYWEKRMEPRLEAFLSEAEKKLNEDKIDLLIISDYNTTGLSGAKADKREKSKWRALTHSNGVTEKGKGSQGSYGIGKNAPFACSSFRTVFYNTYAKEDGIKAFQGVARLITHFDADGDDTIGAGFYQIDDTPIFEDGVCELKDNLNRTEFGTDVVIAGFKKTDTWKEDIEKAILSNFFVSIASEKLIVEIDGQQINSGNIKDRIKIYADKETADGGKEKEITTILEFYHAYFEGEQISGSIMEDNDVTLHLKKDDKYSKSIAEMRSIGMVVRTRHNNIFTRYAAVMVVKPGKLNDLLKNIEPPAHDNWDPGLIEDNKEEQKKATKYRRELIRWVNDTIAEHCRGEEKEEMDLDGMSAYLPFDEDDAGLGDGGENNETKTENKSFGDVTTTSPNVRKKNYSAQKVKGIKDDKKDSHNDGHGGKGKGSAGEEDPKGEDDVTVVKPSGGKIISIPKILRQRVVKAPIDTQYRVLFMLEEDCPKAHISFKTVGDDGRKDDLIIKKYKLDKIAHDVSGKAIELTDLKAKKQYELFVDFEYAERMQLELSIY